MLLNVDGGIIIILLLACFAWLLAKLLFDPFGQMGVNVFS